MSELVGKEIVDLSQGVRWGPVREADLVVDLREGQIEALVIPVRRGWRGHGEVVIPWSRVLKVGRDVIIVDLGSHEPPEGIPVSAGERLNLPRARRTSRRESVEGGNGHWRLWHPGTNREGSASAAGQGFPG
ncbi:MAG: YlmC/YmxH family sporulation protein [Bacillota bacterium]